MKVYTATYYYDWTVATDVYTSAEERDAAVRAWILGILKEDFSKDELEDLKITDDIKLARLEELVSENDLLGEFLYGMFEHDLAA